MDDMRRNLVDLTSTLRRSEAEANAMLQGVVEGVFAVDANRNVRYLNSQAATMVGVAADQALGRFCGDVLRPCAVEGRPPCETSCPILQARSLGQARATERLRASDGSIRTVVITSAGAVDGLQVQVMRDETELEAVRRARDSILANISHEFRTPLAAQLASIELLKDGLAGMRARARRTGRRAAAGHPASHAPDRQPARERAHRVWPARYPPPGGFAARDRGGRGRARGALLTQRGQSLEVALPEVLPAIQADATRLTQVLVNLLANAIKFGPEGGRVYVGGRLEDGDVHLWIEDEGPGVPDLDRGSIFERFYRSSDQEPEPRGLGLGLWIVKSIVERHGGRVEAARTDAGRTRFTVVPPVGETGTRSSRR
jgi:signal transduction histidine kinase